MISDTHDFRRCRARQGRFLAKALPLIRRIRPDFVVGLGDLVAGGGDCVNAPGPVQPLSEQLEAFRKVLLERLDVPFVLVEGNHGLQKWGSADPKVPRKVWEAFWMQSARFLLPQTRFTKKYRRSYRFRYRGQWFSVLGYYGTFGLDPRELAWAKANIHPGDIVFRHINLFGISCSDPTDCGFAIRSTKIPDYDQLFHLMRKRKIRALLSGHTHAFYDGLCGGIRFINTGSLGQRSMEYVKGWDESPFRGSQSFVLVEVPRKGPVRTRFFVFDPECDCFSPFDPAQFPARVQAKKVLHWKYVEGVEALCITQRRESPKIPALGR